MQNNTIYHVDFNVFAPLLRAQAAGHKVLLIRSYQTPDRYIVNALALLGEGRMTSFPLSDEEALAIQNQLPQLSAFEIVLRDTWIMTELGDCWDDGDGGDYHMSESPATYILRLSATPEPQRGPDEPPAEYDTIALSDTPMNVRRAGWALNALSFFTELTGLDPVEDDPHTALVDFLADARHFCDALGLDYGDADRRAQQHYIADLGDARSIGEPKVTKDAVVAAAALDAPFEAKLAVITTLKVRADEAEAEADRLAELEDNDEESDAEWRRNQGRAEALREAIQLVDDMETVTIRGITPSSTAAPAEAPEAEPSLLEVWYRNRAKNDYAVDGEIEVDETAAVSIGEDGAYVAGWLHVAAPPENDQWLTDCPYCGDTLIVTNVTLAATGNRVSLYTPLCGDGFEVNHPDAQDNGSTSDEEVLCTGCKREYKLADLALD
ncbi:MAG: hypothetical protein HC828_01570 [Blastochloris sp.]|nr:hypothetical protein [Blastochloris sp.]